MVETRGEDRQRLPHRWPARQEALGMAGSTHCAELPARGEPMAGSQLWTGSVSAMTDCTRSRHAGWFRPCARSSERLRNVRAYLRVAERLPRRRASVIPEGCWWRGVLGHPGHARLAVVPIVLRGDAARGGARGGRHRLARRVVHTRVQHALLRGVQAYRARLVVAHHGHPRALSAGCVCAAGCPWRGQQSGATETAAHRCQLWRRVHLSTSTDLENSDYEDSDSLIHLPLRWRLALTCS